MNKLFLILILVVVAACAPQTKVEVKSKSTYERRTYTSDKGEHIIISYKQSGKWYLEEFLISPGKLQEKVFSKAFSSLKQLQAYNIRKHLAKLPEVLNVETVNPAFKSTEVENRSIWKVTSAWTLEKEEEYIAWLEENFKKDFFVKHNLETDCADVAFALRWIFARSNGLPAANTMAGSHVLFTQDSMKEEWKHLSTDNEWHKDELFMTALRYLMLNAFTGTLGIDGYPIEITKEAFRVGTIHLTGGHTMLISKILEEGDEPPIWKLSSTVPAAVRELYEEMMIDKNNVDVETGGFLRMRWPELKDGKWTLVEKEKMPLYSLEQYTPEFTQDSKNFSLAVFKKLGLAFDADVILTNSVASIKDDIERRVDIVRSGFEFCSVNDCAEGTLNYEDYSTPSRDKKIAEKFKKVDSLMKQFLAFDEDIESRWQSLKKSNSISVEGLSRNLEEYLFFFEHKLMSYDPSDPIEERWSLSDASVIKSYNKKFKRLLAKRVNLKEKAKVCLENEECSAKKELWTKFNTYEFDQSLKKDLYEVFFVLKEHYPLPLINSHLDTSIDTAVLELPFLMSNPQLEDRSFDQKEFYHMGKVNRLVELTKEIFVVDKKLTNILTGKVLNSELAAQIVVNRNTTQLVSASEKQVTLIDGITGAVISSLSTSFNIMQLKPFGLNYVVAIGCLEDSDDIDPDCPSAILNYDGELKLVHKIAGSYWPINADYSLFDVKSNIVATDISNVFVENEQTSEVYIYHAKKVFMLAAGESNPVKDGSIYARRIISDIQEDGTLNSKLQLKDLTSQKVCTFEMGADAEIEKLISSENLVLMSQNEGDGSNLYKYDLSNCNRSLIKKFKSEWIGVVNRGRTTYFTQLGAADNTVSIYRDTKFFELPLFDKEYVYGHKEDFVSVIKMDVDGITSAYHFNLKSQQKEVMDVNKVELYCGDDGSSINEAFQCRESDNGLKLVLAYEVVGNISKFYGEFVDPNGEQSFSLYQKNELDEYNDEDSKKIFNVVHHSLFHPSSGTAVLDRR